MRRQGAILLAVCLAALAVARPATSQPSGELQLYHIPIRTVDIPVDVSRIEKLSNKPTELQLFARPANGRWAASGRYGLNSLPAITDGKRGFRFTAPEDGEYEFRVQFIYADSVNPRESDLTPELRMMVDTTPPAIEVNVSGKSVAWIASDANRLSTVNVQCKWAKDGNKTFGLDSGEWFTVTPKGRDAFKAEDAFDWSGLLQNGQELWVRISAKDPAGNDGFSPPVRVPGNGTFGTAFPKGNNGKPDWPPSNPGGNGGLPRPQQPRIEYVSSPDVTVDFTLSKVGRSGVSAFHLYLQNQQDANGWRFIERVPKALQSSDKEQAVALKYKAEKEGLYGFYVVPESGAGYKDDPPAKNESPMLFVVVDWTKPYAKITGVQPRRGGVRGPLVDITWEAVDPNLMPRAISLEYSVDKNAAVWKPISVGLDNDAGKDTGRHTWEVPDENLWKFWVRIRAVDKAANTGEHIWEKEVIVDLEKPSGVITGVRGGNSSPPPRENDKPRDNGPPPTTTPSFPTPKPPTTGAPALPELPELPDKK